MKKFKQLNAGWTPAAQWIEDHVWDWSKVESVNGVFDYSGANKLTLLQYQKEILDVILTPWQCECPIVQVFGEDGSQQVLEVAEHDLCHNHREGRVGKFKYSTVVWSQPKKHGKTQIAAAVGAWWACKIQAPDIVMTMASNQEQSAGLIFNSLIPTLYAEGGKVPNSPTSTPQIRVPNGTLLKAIPNNYAGQAGGNYGLTLWSELWTYKTERDRKLYDECPPVPTRFNSIRWIETYAGFEDESDLLKEIFLRVFTDTAETGTHEFSPQGNRVEPVPGLEHLTTMRNGKESPACWHIPEEGLFMFWDHEIRAHVKNGGWITDQYIREEKASNRHSTFVRLWENRWQSSEGTYIDPHVVDECCTMDGDGWGKMVLAGDGSQRNDHTALVGVQKKTIILFGKEQTRYRLVKVKTWDPKKVGVKKGDELHKLGAKEGDLDLTELIAKEVKRIYDLGLMDGPFYYDPAQMHDVAMQLRKLKVPCVEFNQGKERLEADTFLWQLLNKRQIDLFPSVVTEHLKNANAKEAENEMVRIIKGTAKEMRKVDAAVALSMAVWKCSNQVIRKKKKRGPKSAVLLPGQ